MNSTKANYPAVSISRAKDIEILEYVLFEKDSITLPFGLLELFKNTEIKFSKPVFLLFFRR